jgi:Na+-driven multidrug efflux pump
MSVSWTVAGAVGQATATGVGQNLGAETPDRASAVTWTATGATMGLLFAAGGLVWLVPEVAMRVFIADPAVVTEGVVFLRIVALSWAFFGGLMVVQGAFRGAGDTRIAMVLSLLSRWVFRIPVALVLAFSWTVAVPGVGTVSGLDWGAPGLWWAYAVAAVASFALGVLWFLRGTWREGIVEAGRRPEPAAVEEEADEPVAGTEEASTDDD